MKKEGLSGGGDDYRQGGGTSNGGSGEWEERLVGDPIGRRDRELASLRGDLFSWLTPKVTKSR